MEIVEPNGRRVIANVRKVSWASGEMCEFAAALVSAAACLGRPMPYCVAMGTSGAAFRFTLSPGAWEFGNYGIRNISVDPDEPVRRAIEAAGFAYTLRDKADVHDDARAIMDSIDRGIPVLAYGVVGPSDCCIITGYDAAGAVLLGWSAYQDVPDDHAIPHDATGYFRKPGWHASLRGYVLFGGPGVRRPDAALYDDALRWAVCLLRTPRLGDKHTGLAGLRTWAAEMTQPRYFPADDAQVLGQRYVSTAINMTMLRDHCEAEPFLRQAATVLPDHRAALNAAADCYQDVRHLRDEMDTLISDNFSTQAMRAIGDESVRRAYADLILQIAAREQQAADHMAGVIDASKPS